MHAHKVDSDSPTVELTLDTLPDVIISEVVLDETIPEALPVPDLTLNQRKAVLMALVIAAEQFPRRPGFARDLQIAHAMFRELGW